MDTEISNLQAIHIELLDASDNVVFYSAYCDFWIGSGGAQFDGIGNSSVPPPGSDWPLIATSGSVAIEIARDSGGLGTIKWNNGIVLSAMETTPVTAVRLGFFHFPMTGSTFGEISTSELQVDGVTTVPEPSSCALLLLGLTGFCMTRYLRFRSAA